MERVFNGFGEQRREPFNLQRLRNADAKRIFFQFMRNEQRKVALHLATIAIS